MAASDYNVCAWDKDWKPMRPAEIKVGGTTIELYNRWLWIHRGLNSVMVSATGDVVVYEGKYRIEIRTKVFGRKAQYFNVEVYDKDKLIKAMRGLVAYAYDRDEKYIGIPNKYFEGFKKWIGKEDLNKDEAECNQGEYVLSELIREEGMR
ncbi:MAG: hypothetical protein J7M38_06720 [Armatimonadetes bacterium]|nr:hypothetical protein [Armatimonadota bacterium]